MALRRELSLAQATAVNLIDMVGIGPFVTLSLIVADMHGPQAILAWGLGALLALLDGTVWAELGAKWPLAGGSYAFLQKLFPGKTGRFLAFLFIWQTTIQAPLVIASGSIGFAQYAGYLVDLSEVQAKMVSGGLVLLLVWLLYRGIQTVGTISLVLGAVTVLTLIGIVFIGLPHLDLARTLGFIDKVEPTQPFFSDLSQASKKAIYCYLGYYNVCHLGSEIKSPERNIPRAIYLSIGAIAVLYLAMQLVVLSVLPAEEIGTSRYAVSLYVERLLGSSAAQVVTVLILLIALSSLFAVILGYSRVLYAAAAEGNYFRPFARLHARYNFPHVSLLVLGGLGFLFSLYHRLGDIIAAIVIVRILVQFVTQTVGVIRWHYLQPRDERPFRMYLFPLVPLLSIAVWLFVFFLSDARFIGGAVSLIAVGAVVYSLTLGRKSVASQEPS